MVALDQPLSFVLAGFVFYLLHLAVRDDRKRQRLGRLVVNGQMKQDSYVLIARAWCHKRVGLLNHVRIAPGDGLYLPRTRIVHTCGMIVPIDIVFLDRNNRTLLIEQQVSPGLTRIAGPMGTAAVLELAANGAQHLGLAMGDVVSIDKLRGLHTKCGAPKAPGSN